MITGGDAGLIVTADDFGADVAVNEAVERGHRLGVLSAASLMVTGPAAADAVARARAMPGLGVGLHLVLVDGRPALPPAAIPDLVDETGRFRAGMVRAGLGFALRPAVRRQLAEEIEAQFAAFAATGLRLDHVDAHRHFHLHPVIAGLILRIGVRYGLRAARVPLEPRAVLHAVEPATRLAPWPAGPWAQILERRFRAAGVRTPDHVFGLAWSGAMTAERLAGLIRLLPPGVSEIYLHPATHDRFPGHGPGYRHAGELAALLDGEVAAAVRARGLRPGTWTGFA